MPGISLPYQWEPRDYQWDAWEALQTYNRVALCWHRRAGKDEIYLHHNACSAMERVGNYWYMLPEYAQCRKAIWEAVNPHTGKKRIDEAFPHEIRANTLQQEMKLVFKNGSTWQLMGSDNYDSLVGSPPIGLTFSEFSIANPFSWDYLSPIVLENNGWAIFNGTPRGKNHWYKMIQSAPKMKGWFSQLLTNDDTHVFTEEQMQDELIRLQDLHDETYGKAIWLQEYFCSFDAARPGSVWGESMVKLQVEGRITDVPYNPAYPVHSAWDLGHDDDTAIWFFQVIDGDVKVIDYHASNFKDIEYYSTEVLKPRAEKWTMGTHWLPHDAFSKTLAAGGKNISLQFHEWKKEIQLERIDIGDFGRVPGPTQISKEDGIQAARATLKKTYFDKKLSKHIDHLKEYRRKYDEELKTFSTTTVHDEHSHAADAFRYLSLVWRKARETQQPISLEQQLLNNDIKGISFGELRQQHFRKMRRQRMGL